jgi:riboflavin kinase/FMN adenylyltransferase
MLGRPYSVYGRVIHGDKRGRTIGFATANIDLHHELRPPQGVYGACVLTQGKSYLALVNIGVRPTFKDRVDVTSWESRDRYETVEVHLLGFEGDLYDENVEVTFLRHLREERAFDSAEALKAQIELDREGFLSSLSEAARETNPH